MLISLNSKVAFVCGASQGIGKAIAYQFAFAGAKVILLARNEENLSKNVFELRQKTGIEHSYICCDISNHNDLESKVKHILEQNQSIDVLVNNTGGPAPGKLTDAELEDFQKAFAQHILSAQLLVKLLLPGMISKNFGRIINIVSVGMRQPIDNLGVSNTIRGAMGSWAKTLSREVAPYGITVNNILPGYTATERLQFLLEQTAFRNNTSYDMELNKILERIPAKRLGSPDEIAYLATFLASDYASYINGASIPVDGGFLFCI
jgi:3-oxoacyl-[acyl-carrier protein] reductase